MTPIEIKHLTVGLPGSKGSDKIVKMFQFFEWMSELAVLPSWQLISARFSITRATAFRWRSAYVAYRQCFHARSVPAALQQGRQANGRFLPSHQIGAC